MYIQNRDDETIEKLFFDVMMRRLKYKRYTHLCA